METRIVTQKIADLLDLPSKAKNNLLPSRLLAPATNIVTVNSTTGSAPYVVQVEIDPATPALLGKVGPKTQYSAIE